MLSMYVFVNYGNVKMLNFFMLQLYMVWLGFEAFVATNTAGDIPGAKSVSTKDATLTKAGSTKNKKRALMIR